MTLRAPFIPENNIALFLDVDGTLLELAATPDSVKVPASLRNTLHLASKGASGALALISGRSISTLDRLFSPYLFPAAGKHGLERRDATGKLILPEINQHLLDPVREALQYLQATHNGLLLEDKGDALAFHYRGAPKHASLVHDTMQELMVPIMDQFNLNPGKFVYEITPRGFSKRTAIESFMREAPFAGRTAVFIGDDVTDEDGFGAVNDMGGYSVRVGPIEQSAARYQFGSVQAVIAWLRERNLKLRKA